MKNKIVMILGIGIVLLVVLVPLLSKHSYSKAVSRSFSRKQSNYLASEVRSDETARARRGTVLSVIAPMTKAVASNPVNVVSRKLIKNAVLTLEVKDCVKTKENLVALVEKRKGTILNAQIDEALESPKNGSVVFKILPSELESILRDVRRLGRVRYESMGVEDVTETYVDLQTRLKSQRSVRDRFVAILNDKAHQVKDIVEIEKELARVDVEIEALEGRIKYLDSQIDLSTVTVNFSEEQVNLLSALDLGEKFREAVRTAAVTSVNAVYAIIVLIGLVIPFGIAAGLIWLAVIVIKKMRGKK